MSVLLLSDDNHGGGGHGSEADAGAAAEGRDGARRDLDTGGVRPVRATADIKSDIQGSQESYDAF